MLNKGNIGVVLATYNGEKYIREQLESIINQTVKPDYIVISDGSSMDKTVEICLETLGNSGIQHDILISEKRLLVNENFQRGLEYCNTDYIFFSDQDDVWIDNKIETTLKYFNEKNVCMVFSNAKIVNNALETIGKGDLWNLQGYYNDGVIRYNKDDEEFVNILIKHNIVTGMCMAITNQLREIAIPFSTHAIHDKWISLLSISVGDVVAINEKTVLYRQHGKNVVGTKTNIIQKLKRKNEYLNRLNDRIAFILDVVNNDKNIIKEENRINLIKYLEHLKSREKYLNRKENLIYPILNYNNYFLYEYRAFRIMIKDIIYYIFH